MRRHRIVLAAVVAAWLAAAPAKAQPAAWEQWQHQVGVVDLGVRADGTLVSMAAGRLYLVSPGAPALTPFSTGAGGYSGDPNAEPYFIVTPPVGVGASGNNCQWAADDLYILDVSAPPGIVRVDPLGTASRFATLNGVDTLGGIALDTSGFFDHRLVVTGTHNSNQTTVFTVSCDGSVATVTTSAPQVEGGIVVAPPTFGQFGGNLIAPDENSGQVWAIDASGKVSLVIDPGLPTGGDTGVESGGFVPPGFIASDSGNAGSGFAYLADRGTPNNPFPGTDSILRLSAVTLAAAGVQDGDLLMSTEGNGTTVAIRCADTCSIVAQIAGTPGGHIEGHVVFVPQ